jgi:gliding motility-associated-like protein
VIDNAAIEVPDFASSIALCSGDEVLIGPTAFELTDATWSDDADAPFPRSIDETGLYTIVVTDSCGSRQFDISVTPKNCGCDIYIPNCFTPDNDGLNDVFYAEINCELTFYDLRIFNTWGQEIFQSSDPTQKWTGGASNPTGYFAQDGVYNYILNVQTATANASEIVQSIAGSVILIR